MSEEILEKSGLHIDPFNKLRLIKPDLADSAGQLCDEIKNFSTLIARFQTEASEIISTLNNFSEIINLEKIAAMTSQYALKNDGIDAVDDIQRLEILIREKRVELERLQAELEASQREEEEQKEYLQKLLWNA